MASYIQPTHATLEEPEHHEHPNEAKYIKIATILTIITIVEVAIYYIDAFEAILVPTLVVLSTIKFVMVVGYFMHLKFDDKQLAWIFASGMGVALAIYLGTWAVMHYDQLDSFVSNMF